MKLKNTMFVAALMIFVFFSTSLTLAASVTGGYDKGLYIKTTDGKYKLKFNVLMQPQYQFLYMEGQDETSSFQIRNARLFFKGNAFTKDLTYKFEFQALAGRTSNVNEGFAYVAPAILDAYANYNVGYGIEIRAGQFKPFYNREELTPATKQQFVDRSLVNEVFSFGRDLGVAAHGKCHDNKFEYAFYATNEGANRSTANNNIMFLIGGRFVGNILGKHGYIMSDIENSTDPILALGVAANFNRTATSITSDDESVMAITGDVAFRYLGVSFLGEGNYFRNWNESADTFGVLGQVGYFVLSEKFEIAGRFGGVIPRTAGAANGYEGTFGLNYFIFGRNVKVQTDYSYLHNSALSVAGITNSASNVVTASGVPGFVQDQQDHRVRLQMQFYF